jgi:DNA polymerase delta subunit 2
MMTEEGAVPEQEEDTTMMADLTDADLEQPPERLQRATAAWQPRGGRFAQATSELPFGAPSYGSLYMIRLNELRERLRTASAEKWAGGVVEGVPFAEQISSVQKETDTVVLGTIYRQLKLKPDVLAEFASQRELHVRPTVSTYISEDAQEDASILEDDSGRLQIVVSGEGQAAAAGIERLCTGVPMAVRGRLVKGKLVVDDFCIVGIAPQRPLPQLSADKYVLLASDLQLGRPGTSPLLAQLLADFVTGHVGAGPELSLSASIVRVVLAGNTVCAPSGASGTLQAHEPMGRAAQEEAAGGVRALDLFMSQLCASVDVDIMPGACDPANCLLPQQPLHSVLLQQSSELSSCHRVTNPYECSVDGVELLGTSGQNVADLSKYDDTAADAQAGASGAPVTGVLERLLRASHLAPTAPDTLECHPFSEIDPFVLNECPHVLFAGCSARGFESRIVEGEKGQVRECLVPGGGGAVPPRHHMATYELRAATCYRHPPTHPHDRQTRLHWLGSLAACV